MFEKEFVDEIDAFLAHGTTIAVLGIGNEDNGDDAVALHVIKELETYTLPDQVKLLYCERVPEHFVGKVEKLKANRVLMLDAADMNEVSGAIAIVPNELVSSGYHFSTHTLSLTLMETFLKASIPDVKVMFIGIQPEHTWFEEPLSKNCQIAVAELSSFLKERFNLTFLTKNNNL